MRGKVKAFDVQRDRRGRIKNLKEDRVGIDNHFMFIPRIGAFVVVDNVSTGDETNDKSCSGQQIFVIIH